MAAARVVTLRRERAEGEGEEEEWGNAWEECRDDPAIIRGDLGERHLWRAFMGCLDGEPRMHVSNDVLARNEDDEDGEDEEDEEDDAKTAWDVQTFVTEDFTRRPVVVRVAPTRPGEDASHEFCLRESRIGYLVQAMYGGDVEELVENTSSEDGVFAWLAPLHDEAEHLHAGHDGEEEEGGNRESEYSEESDEEDEEDVRLMSVKTRETSAALSMFRAGHSLYFRAPPHVEAELVTTMQGALGLHPLARNKGEVETFVSRVGHKTGWHFDWQENFTVQLAGVKTWQLVPSSITSPLRGCTPHFDTVAAAEQQLRLHRMQDPSFAFAPPAGAVVDGIFTVTLYPGDTLYHPAGYWHRVICENEQCLSINISLIAPPAADLVLSGVRQLLLADPEFRRPFLLTDQDSAEHRACTVLHAVCDMIQSKTLRADMLCPTVLSRPVISESKMAELCANDSARDQTRTSPKPQDPHEEEDEDEDKEEAEDAAEADEDEDEDEDEENDDENDDELPDGILRVGQPPVPADWWTQVGWKHTSLEDVRFQSNPLCAIVPIDDLIPAGVEPVGARSTCLFSVNGAFGGLAAFDDEQAFQSQYKRVVAMPREELPLLRWLIATRPPTEFGVHDARARARLPDFADELVATLWGSGALVAAPSSYKSCAGPASMLVNTQGAYNSPTVEGSGAKQRVVRKRPGGARHTCAGDTPHADEDGDHDHGDDDHGNEEQPHKTRKQRAQQQKNGHKRKQKRQRLKR